jgi:hypothetical protein
MLQSCWLEDPAGRPAFLDLHRELGAFSFGLPDSILDDSAV